MRESHEPENEPQQAHFTDRFATFCEKAGEDICVASVGHEDQWKEAGLAVDRAAALLSDDAGNPCCELRQAEIASERERQLEKRKMGQ